MSPIDDELRTALSSRTDAVELSPEFFSGIERRARGLRRRKVAATVAGSALAVSALGLGGPVVASLLATSGTTKAPQASSAPTLSPAPVAVAAFALDPAAPWAYRGDELGQGTADTIAREWATARGLTGEQVRLSPLYGETLAGEELVFFVASGPDGAARWGVSRSTEAGPELVVDEPVGTRTYALPLALTVGGVDRLVVVAAPETTLDYAPEVGTEWRAMEDVDPGVGATDLDGDPAADQVRVTGPAGEELAMVAAPSPVGSLDPQASPAPSEAPEDEGPGTDTPVAVDPAPYGLSLSLDDDWGYRGSPEPEPADIAVQSERLFVEGGSDRADGSWSDRPLANLQQDGTSILVALRVKDGRGIVTTTWVRDGEPARQAEQEVVDGQLVVQSFVPLGDGSGLLLALAAQRTGAVETTAKGFEQLHNDDGYGLFRVAPASGPGDLLLYSQGDGLEYHSEPVRRS